MNLGYASFGKELCRAWLCLSLLAILLSGCDSYFLWQIDVDAQSTGEISVFSSVDETSLVDAIRTYSTSNGLACEKTAVLPIRCVHTPIRIFAFKTTGGATICYGALGIPFETRKYYERTQDLKRVLVARFGERRVLSNPMASSWSERCERGARSDKL